MKRNLMNELKEGIEALAEERNMTRDQLLKDYARIIDEQKQEIERLQYLNESYLEQLNLSFTYRDRIQRENEILENNVKNLEIELEELRVLYDESSNPHHKDGR